jgi:hypothetical protein
MLNSVLIAFDAPYTGDVSITLKRRDDTYTVLDAVTLTAEDSFLYMPVGFLNIQQTDEIDIVLSASASGKTMIAVSKR